MKRLLFAIVLFAPSAHAESLGALPVAEAPAEINGLFSRWDEPLERQCMLRAKDDRAIFLRWNAAESTLERSVVVMYDKDDIGKTVRRDPQYGYRVTLAVESVTKVRASKIVERDGFSVWAYREANAVVVFTPEAGQVLATTSFRTRESCPMAMAMISTKPASECKTTDGCGRMALLSTATHDVIVGFSENTLSARITARK